MLSPQEMNARLDRLFEKKLNFFLDPLATYLDLAHFYYYQISNSGHFVNIGTNPAWKEFYFSNDSHLIHTPYLRHPDHFANGVSFVKGLEHQEFEKLVEQGGERFNVNLSLQFMNKTDEGIEAFGFGINSKALTHHLSLYQELPMLRLFIKKFKEAFHPFFPILKDHQIDLARLVGKDFYKQPAAAGMPKSRSRSECLKKLGLDISTPLTAREQAVIKYLLNGNSASQIAKELSISTRTVEHHMERIKNKLNCFSKGELMQKALFLESLGELSI